MIPSTADASTLPHIIITSEMNRRGETGVQTHFNDVIEHLQKDRHSVVFLGPAECRMPYLHLRLTRGLIARLLPYFPEFAFSGMRYIDFYATRRELRKRLKGKKGWSVYAQDPITALAALSMKRSPSQSIVLAVHYNESQAEEMANRGLISRKRLLYARIRQQEHFVLDHVDRVVVFSAFMKDLLLKQTPIQEKVVVIPNAAHVPQAPEDNSALYRADLIAIGSLEPRKNQAFLLEVLSAAKAKGYLYTLNLFGSGESRPMLERLAKELGVSEQVTFLGRVTPASSHLSGHKLFVHAARIENLPIAIIEALAAGIPILAPAIGGIPEIFQNGMEGYFWDINDVSRSAELLVRVMEDETLRQQMSASARRRYFSNFTPDTVFNQLSRIIVKAEDEK